MPSLFHGRGEDVPEVMVVQPGRHVAVEASFVGIDTLVLSMIPISPESCSRFRGEIFKFCMAKNASSIGSCSAIGARQKHVFR
ncbi:MAG: hypothetical protein D6741_11155 [Planctomycetota bacterium]|nr:MAG: hypothetical protein D6741_11155 [Planctomycetota bacterium]